ncbi:hypothetical protein B4U79_12252, partial [Dinothrombium tinctorium]
MTYEEYYLRQAGSGIPGFRAVRFQRGKGFFGNFWKTIAWPLLKYAGKTAVKTGMDIGRDAIEGKPVKESIRSRIQEHGMSVIDDTAEKTKQLLQGGRGRKPKEETKDFITARMNPIHELSAVTPLPEFDLFVLPPTQTTVERDILTEHRPISTLDSKSAIEFIINSSNDEYINFRETFLYVRIHVELFTVEGNNPTWDVWDNIIPANYLLHSMFKHLDVFIGDKQINTSSTTYPYRAYLEALLSLNEESKRSYLQAALWIRDDDLRKKFIKPDSEPVAEGKILDLMGRLHFDLTFQDRAMIGGTSIQIRLVPHDKKFYFMYDEEKYNATIKFHEAALFVHRSKVSKE